MTIQSLSNRSRSLIKIQADAKVFDSPTDSTTGSQIKLRQSDSYFVGVVLLMNGKCADISGIVSLSLEILDIGNRNAPEPRTAKLLVKKTIQASDIDSSVSDVSVGNGEFHAVFSLDESDTIGLSGDKFLRIYAELSDDAKITYSAGWCSIEPSYDKIQISSPSVQPYATKDFANAKFLSKISNLADLPSPQTARDNIGCASKSGLNELSLYAEKKGGFCLSSSSVAIGAMTFPKIFTVMVTIDAGYCGTVWSKGNTSLSVDSDSNLVLSDGEHTHSEIVLANGVHSVSVAVEESCAYIAVDNSVCTNDGLEFAFLDDGGAFVLGGNNARGKLMNIKVFNFNVINTDAEYDISKYSQGIDESPTLKKGGVLCDSALLQETSIIKTITNNDSFTLQNGEISLSLAPTSSSRYLCIPLSRPVLKGETITVKWTSSGTSPWTYAAMGTKTKAVSSGYLGGRYALPSGTYSHTATNDLYYFLVSKNGDLGIVHNCTFSVQIFKRGTIVSLSDTADAYQIRDTSGNFNDAVARGSTLPYRRSNNSIVRFSIQFPSGISAGSYALYYGNIIPANSLVEIFAKTDSPSSLSFGTSSADTSSFGSISASSAWTQHSPFVSRSAPSALYVSSSAQGVKADFILRISQ